MESEYVINANPLDWDDTEMIVRVNKVGGGTTGQDYEGDWDVTVTRIGYVGEWHEVIHTGTPKTHAEVAWIGVEFYTEEWE